MNGWNVLTKDEKSLHSILDSWHCFFFQNEAFILRILYFDFPPRDSSDKFLPKLEQIQLNVCRALLLGLPIA